MESKFNLFITFEDVHRCEKVTVYSFIDQCLMHFPSVPQATDYSHSPSWWYSISLFFFLETQRKAVMTDHHTD